MIVNWRQHEPTLEDILSEASEFWKERHLGFWIFVA